MKLDSTDIPYGVAYTTCDRCMTDMPEGAGRKIPVTDKMYNLVCKKCFDAADAN